MKIVRRTLRKMKMSVWSHVSIHVVGEGIMDSMQRAATILSGVDGISQFQKAFLVP
jgi:hypothetical protein